MSCVVETRDSCVGRGFTPAASSDNEIPAAINGRPTAIPPSNNQKPTTNNATCFDAAALHAQLAGLLQLYLARAADPDAVKQCSAKDAISCAKALTAMMSDVQGGRPASVDSNTDWPRMKSHSRQASTRVGGAHQRRSESTSCSDSPKSRASEPGLLNEGSVPGYPLPATRCSSLLNDALAAVLSTDQESHLNEPYQRVLSRMDRLCNEVQARLDAASYVGAQHAVPVSNCGNRGDTPKSRAGEPGLPSKASHVLPSNQQPKTDNPSCAPAPESGPRRDPDTASASVSPCTCSGPPLKGGREGGLGDGSASSCYPADNGRLTADDCASALKGGCGGGSDSTAASPSPNNRSVTFTGGLGGGSAGGPARPESAASTAQIPATALSSHNERSATFKGGLGGRTEGGRADCPADPKGGVHFGFAQCPEPVEGRRPRPTAGTGTACRAPTGESRISPTSHIL